MAEKKAPGTADRQFIRRALIVIALAASAFLIWQLRYVLVLLFGAIVIATIIRALADPISRRLRGHEGIAVLIAVLTIAAAIAVVAWLLGRQIAAQTELLTDTLPRAIKTLDQWFEGFGLRDPLESWLSTLRSRSGDLVARFGGLLSTVGAGIANLLIVIFGGIFLAAQPRFYRTGAIKLVPPPRRDLVAEAMDESERALRLWLKGQLISMLIVGVMTGVGLWLIGVESALVLGLLAGVLEFVPFAGPIVAAVPGIMIALVQSPELALWTTLIYFGVQQSEAYLIQPLVQQYAVELPAVVLLFSLLAFALLFGVIGVFFAAPLTVVTYVLVKRLYVREALHTPTPIPGEGKR